MSGGVASLSSLPVVVEGCSFSGRQSLTSFCSSIDVRHLQSTAFDDIMEICESGSVGSDVIKQEGINYQKSPLNYHSHAEQQQQLQQQSLASHRISSINDQNVGELEFQIIGRPDRTFDTDMVDVLCGVDQGTEASGVSGNSPALTTDMDENVQVFQTMRGIKTNDKEPSDRGSPTKSEVGGEKRPRPETPQSPIGQCRMCGTEVNGAYFNGVSPICMPCQAVDDIQSSAGMFHTLNGMTASNSVPSGRRSVAGSDGGLGHQPAPSTPKMPIGPCRVCGDDATGMYFGALVCVPCKTFFLRYAGDGFSFICKFNKSCEITVATRTQCKYCRYQKCKLAGMYRRVRPASVQLSEGQQLCVVCHDVANGIHFGAITCEGCKKFFRRGLTENSSYVCKSGQNCVINPRTRNACRYCRYQTCLNVGMSREAIQMGRPSKMTPDGQTLQRPVHCKVEGGGPLSPTMTNSISQLPPGGPGGWRMIPSYDDNNATPIQLTWSSHEVSGQLHRRPNHSDSWSSSGVGSEFGVDGGLLGVDDLPPPKRRMSDSYMSSSSSQYQFSPVGGGHVAGPGNANGGADSVGDRSRISSASSSGHEGLVASTSASNVGTGLRPFVVGSSCPGAPWLSAPPNCLPPAPVYSAGGQFVERLNTQTNLMPVVVSSQQNEQNGVCMWQLNFLQPGVSNQPPFTMDHSAVRNLPLYNASGSSGPFAAHQHHQFRHQQQLLQQQQQQQLLQPQIIGSISIARNDSKSNSSMTADRGAMHVGDLSDQIQHIMSESSAVIANCERSLNFPTSMLRATSSISDLGVDSGSGQRLTARHKNPSGAHDASVGLIMSTIDEEVIAAGKAQSLAATAVYGDPSTSSDDRDDRKSIGSLSNFDSVASEQHDYSRLTDPMGVTMVTDGTLAEHFPVDHLSTESNHSDWMDQMTEHLVKDNIVVDAGICFNTNQVMTPAIVVEKPTQPSVYDQNLSTGDPELDEQVKSSIDYWLHPELPDENVMLASRHWAVLNKIMPAYCRFVQLGNNINKGLKAKFDGWTVSHPDESERQSKLSVWIQQNVVPVYTYSSVSFFNCLPGFSHFTPTDKGILIRCGQSMSRILVAALHWYVAEDRNFRNFLSWRTMKPGQVDRFKQSLIEYADRITAIEVDPIEASMLNALTVIASDYKGLENPRMIEESRSHILGTFRAYTTAKYGTPNRRIEQLFEFIPEVRRLGLIHYKMTQSATMGVTAGGILAASSCNNTTSASTSSTSSPAYTVSGGSVFASVENKDNGAL